MPNQEQQREDKLRESAGFFARKNSMIGSSHYDRLKENLITFAKSPEVREYHKQPPTESDAWISVDTPPEKSGYYYMCWYPINNMACMAVYNKYENSFRPTVDMQGNPTHWQPLPAVPKTQTTK